MGNIHVHNSTKPIKVRVTKPKINVTYPGTQGPTGPQGPQGATGPQGPSGTGDKTYTVNFSFATSVLVTHNLNKYPSILLLDSAETEMLGAKVEYHDLNSCTVSWLAPFTGMAVAN